MATEKQAEARGVIDEWYSILYDLNSGDSESQENLHEEWEFLKEFLRESSDEGGQNAQGRGG